MTWATAYLGLSEAECHCWGLVVRVFRTELGIELPTYDGPACTSAERAEIAALVEGSETSCWRMLDDGEARQPFDVAAFRRGPVRQHVGVLVNARHMLHMHRRAVVQPVNWSPWGPRLAGVYRHLLSPFEEALK